MAKCDSSEQRVGCGATFVSWRLLGSDNQNEGRPLLLVPGLFEGQQEITE